MSPNVHSIESTAGIAEAARMMGEFDIGVLPVVDDGELVGIVTDRDLAVRGLVGGLHSGSPIMQVMSADVHTCLESDDLDDALRIMARQQVRRLPVCSEAGELVGMVSIGDLAKKDDDEEEVTEALRDICRPAGLHSQRPRAA
ncbi:MAG TPA: CBS domain-containing protein [Sphingomonadaceae bacterium]|nr:CBS domain-containing protein [Sphingomonadaceae bacterium]